VGRRSRSRTLGRTSRCHRLYERLGDWFTHRHLRPPALMWEEYLVGPDQGGEAGCLTRVVVPLS